MNKTRATEPKEARIIYCSFLDYEEMRAIAKREPIDERIRLVGTEWCEPGVVYIEYTDGTRERITFLDAIKESRS